MARAVASTVRRALGALEPPPRLVDWALLVVVVSEAVSGLYSFTVADPSWWPLWWAHRAAGLTLVLLLAYKLARVAPRLTDRTRWTRATPVSVLALVAALGAIGTGMLWVFGVDVRLSYWTLLSVHVAFGLVLVPLVVVHLSSRYAFPTRADFDGRRTTLRFATLLTAGLLVSRGQDRLNRAFDTPGAARRFTGSYPREGAGNAAFPVTAWVADDPSPISTDAWRLSVRGEVDTRFDLGYDAVTDDVGQAVEPDALLDCTSGWYTVQDWQGVRVGDLLDAASPTAGARYVRFVSVTGYRWTLPIDEARDALLATRVADEPLTHGHGAPLRLVAPGRRGFQWVKWVTRVDVRRDPDPAQWVVTLVSGFDD